MLEIYKQSLKLLSITKLVNLLGNTTLAVFFERKAGL
jgi:hypothetical protein